MRSLLNTKTQKKITLSQFVKEPNLMDTVDRAHRRISGLVSWLYICEASHREIDGLIIRNIETITTSHAARIVKISSLWDLNFIFVINERRSDLSPGPLLKHHGRQRGSHRQIDRMAPRFLFSLLGRPQALLHTRLHQVPTW